MADLAVLIRQLQGKVTELAAQVAGLVVGKVLQLAVQGVGRKIAFGASTANGGGTTTGNTTITHGLGATPIAVFVCSGDGNLVGSANTPTSTTFIAQLRHVDGLTWTATFPFYWLAIG